MDYIKILRQDMTHHGFIYKNGLNIDTVPFYPKGTCTKGGLYFCKAHEVYRYLTFGVFMADAQVYQEDRKLKADRIIIKNNSTDRRSYSLV
jgi:hypothetical protein